MDVPISRIEHAVGYAPCSNQNAHLACQMISILVEEAKKALEQPELEGLELAEVLLGEALRYKNWKEQDSIINITGIEEFRRKRGENREEELKKINETLKDINHTLLGWNQAKEEFYRNHGYLTY